MKARERKLFEKCERYMECRNQRRLFDLLTRNPDIINWLPEGDSSLLDRAVNWKLYVVVEWLLRRRADANLVYEGGDTPLIHTAAQNDHRMAELLIRFGADIEKPNDQFETPLGFACAWQSVEVAKLLCEAGANVNGTEGWGASYLWGVQCWIERHPDDQRSVEIANILIAHGAKVIHEEPKLPPPPHNDGSQGTNEQ